MSTPQRFVVEVWDSSRRYWRTLDSYAPGRSAAEVRRRVMNHYPDLVSDEIRVHKIPARKPNASRHARRPASRRASAYPEKRKRNSVRPDGEVSARFWFNPPIGDDAEFLREMQDNGLEVEVPFELMRIYSDNIIERLMQKAADMLSTRRGPWRNMRFGDGSAISDEGRAIVTVHDISTQRGGLGGDEHSFDVTMRFPPVSRYVP